MSEKNKIRVHFVSGKTFDFSLDDEKFDKLMKCLDDAWCATAVRCEHYGMHFSHITHYQINPED